MKNQQAVGPELRPYQRALVRGIREAFTKTSRVLAVLPTGGARLWWRPTSCGPPWKKGRRVLAVAHREGVSGPAQGGAGPGSRALPGGGSRLPPRGEGSRGGPLRRRVYPDPRPAGAGRWDMVVVDEAHHLPADTYQDIVRGEGGFSGSPPRPSGRTGVGSGSTSGPWCRGPPSPSSSPPGTWSPQVPGARGGGGTPPASPCGGRLRPREVEALAREVRLGVEVVKAYSRAPQGKAHRHLRRGGRARPGAGRAPPQGGGQGGLPGRGDPLQERQEDPRGLQEGDLEVLVERGPLHRGLRRALGSLDSFGPPHEVLGALPADDREGPEALPREGRHPGGGCHRVNYRAFGPVEAYTRWTLTKDEGLPRGGAGFLLFLRPAEGGSEGGGGDGRLKEVSPEELGERKAFYLGLLWYARQRGFKEGWAYYRYLERFGRSRSWAWREEEPAFPRGGLRLGPGGRVQTPGRLSPPRRPSRPLGALLPFSLGKISPCGSRSSSSSSSSPPPPRWTPGGSTRRPGGSWATPTLRGRGTGGLDCSGLGAVPLPPPGGLLPRTSREQHPGGPARCGPAPPRDLLFFSGGEAGGGPRGVYLYPDPRTGEPLTLHAPGRWGRVVVEAPLPLPVHLRGARGGCVRR